MPSTSYVSIRCSTRALFVSTTVTLWPSSLSCRARAVPTLPLPHQNDLHNKSFLLWQPLSRGIQIQLSISYPAAKFHCLPHKYIELLKKRRFFCAGLPVFSVKAQKWGCRTAFCAAASLGQNDSECPPRALWASSVEKYRYKSKISPAVRSQYRSTPSLVTRAYTSGASSGFSAPYTRPLRYSAAAASNLSAAP